MTSEMTSFKWLSHDEFKALTSMEQLQHVKKLIAFLKEEEARQDASSPERPATPDGPARK